MTPMIRSGAEKLNITNYMIDFQWSHYGSTVFYLLFSIASLIPAAILVAKITGTALPI